MTHAMQSILLGGAIVLASVLPRGACAQELSAPIVAFTPGIAKNADALGLTGALEARLVMLRSDCTDHWRAVLTEDQFARMLAMAGG